MINLWKHFKKDNLEKQSENHRNPQLDLPKPRNYAIVVPPILMINVSRETLLYVPVVPFIPKKKKRARKKKTK